MILKSYMKLSLLLVTLMLSACGPIYQTRYSYFPPTATKGKMCINQCLLNSQQCGNDCNTQQNSCKVLDEIRAQNEYNAYIKRNCQKVLVYAENQQSYGYGRSIGGAVSKKMQCDNGSPKSIDYFRNSYGCSSAFDDCSSNCKNMYNSCYTNCGGKVVVYQVCVAFCDKK